MHVFHTFLQVIAGHSVHDEQPEIYTKILEVFIKTVQVSQKSKRVVENLRMNPYIKKLLPSFDGKKIAVFKLLANSMNRNYLLQLSGYYLFIQKRLVFKLKIRQFLSIFQYLLQRDMLVLQLCQLGCNLSFEQKHLHLVQIRFHNPTFVDSCLKHLFLDQSP